MNEPTLGKSPIRTMGDHPDSWSEQCLPLAGELLNHLRIDDRQWHRLKSNPDRRAAELLAAALAQHLAGGSNQEVEQLTQQALGWLRRELRDPGCPRH